MRKAVFIIFASIALIATGRWIAQWGVTPPENVYIESKEIPVAGAEKQSLSSDQIETQSASPERQ